MKVKRLDHIDPAYGVQDDGKVFSNKSGQRRELSGGVSRYKTDRPDSIGYKVVTLSVNGKCTTHTVHRLVAIAFIPNPNGKPFVNHLDGNKHNNHVSNLEWVTGSENTQHAWDTGLLTRKFGGLNRSTTRDETLDKFILTGDQSGYSIETLVQYITSGDMVRNDLPPELVECSLKNGSYLETWEYWKLLFRSIDAKLTLSTISSLVGICDSQISRIRSGKVATKERAMYDSYFKTQK